MGTESQPAGQSVWSRSERVIEDFEAAWQRGERPEIGEYVHADSDDSLLVELVHTELECRLKAGETLRVEHYFERFPALVSDRTAALALIAAEYKLRQRSSASVEPDEYFQRFPQYREALASQLARRAGNAPSSLVCPNCRQCVAARPPSASQTITCSACGNSFRFDLELTTPFALAEQPQIGPFKLLEVVGQGAFGTVYRAQDTRLDRIVAVKVPRGGRWLSSADHERFEREARSAAQLVHPGIVPLFEVGTEAPVPYLVSAFVEGKTLADAIALRRYGFRETAEIAAQVAEALDYAHRRGVVHRDLKPSNVMLGRLAGTGVADQNDSSGAFVMDFGLARRDDGEISVTVDGQVLGTPAYMSPEQARGEAHGVDGRTDVYSVGVVLYEMLTGELPFRGVARMVLHQILYDDPRPPRQLNDKIPRDFETIVLKCLVKEPHRRYATAGELATDLRHYLNGEPILARPSGRMEKAWRWAKRNPRVSGLSAAVAGLLLILAVGGPLVAWAFILEAAKAVEAQDKAVDAQKDAEESATIAKQQVQLSNETLDKLIFEVQDQLRDRPAMHKLKENLLNIAILGLEKVAVHAENSRPDVSAAVAHKRLGDTFLFVGRAPQAKQQFDKARSVAQGLVGKDPSNAPARRALLEAYQQLIKLGLRENDLTPVALNVDAALSLARALVAEPLDDLADKRSLAISLAQSGRLRLRLNDPRHALGYFRESLDLRTQIAVAEPTDVTAKRDVATIYDNISEVGRALGDRALLLEGSHKALEIREAAVAKSADNRAAQLDVGLSCQRLTDAYLLLGDTAKSREFQNRALHTYASLKKDDPEALAPELQTAGGYAHLALADAQDGNFTGAVKHCGRGIALLERLDALGKLAGQSYWRNWLTNMRSESKLFEDVTHAIGDISYATSQPAARASELLCYRAIALTRQERLQDARATIDELRRLDCDTPQHWYHVAAACAVCAEGLKTEDNEDSATTVAPFVRHALTAIGKAVDSGYADMVRLKLYPDLAAIRMEPEFQSILDRVESGMQTIPKNH